MPCLRPQDGSSLILAVGKPSSRPRLSPWMTSPETNQGAPRSSAASTTLPWPSAVRTAPDDTGRPSSSSGGTMSTAKPSSRALLGQISRRAGAVLAEMEIEADRRAADAEAADQDALDEILRRGGGERGVEGHDDGAVEPGRRQQPQLVALARELEQRVLRPQEQPRMRREGQRRGLAAERLRRACSAAPITARWPRCTPSKLPIATTAPASAPGVAVAHDMKGVGRRFVHRTAGT